LLGAILAITLQACCIFARVRNCCAFAHREELQAKEKRRGWAAAALRS
jgi:hypothetical protein